MLKMAVLAPIPSASAKIATAAKPGWRRSIRRPKAMSWRRQSHILLISLSSSPIGSLSSSPIGGSGLPRAARSHRKVTASRQHLKSKKAGHRSSPPHEFQIPDSSFLILITATAAGHRSLGRGRHEAFGAEISIGGTGDLVAVHDDAVERRRARLLVLAGLHHVRGVRLGHLGERLVAEGERVGERLRELGLRLQILLEVL